MPDFSLENGVSGQSIGVDEAGRGPWAGPVSVAACWLDRSVPDSIPAGLDDSKKLAAARRAILFEQLTAGPHLYSLRHVDVAVIDREGILKATLAAMAEVAADLQSRMISLGYDAPAQTLVDGNQMPPTTMPARCIVRGDSASLSIAAASIIAKHSRDLLMVDLDQSHPGYGWATNMGYGTKAHQAGLDHFGLTPHHRHSFKPIRRYLDVGD